MKVTKREFLAEVKRELKHIRNNATSEEIGNLDFSTLNYNSTTKCIYGQMTGYCSGERACQLYAKTWRWSGSWDDAKSEFPNWNSIDKLKGHTSTALEKFLYISTRPMHSDIIKYLKGEIKTITLTCI